MVKEQQEKKLDRIRGSLVGGAIGDALGYAIEFEYEPSIFRRFGREGIQEYLLDRNSRKALISDDTQMTLFTANGLLVYYTRRALKGVSDEPHIYVNNAYHDWLITQDSMRKKVNLQGGRISKGGCSWLLDVPELYSQRAPGNTCLSALRYPKKVNDYLSEAVNDSKGCGGIMRVAPVALFFDASKDAGMSIENIDREGAYIAALTHGHPLGFMPAAVVTHIINRIVYGPKMNLADIVLEAKWTCQNIFEGFSYLKELVDIIDLAIALADNSEADLDNIHRIGEGWVAEETLGIALYCALKYQNDFSKAIITSVNHGGDSDSTGAVTGNILGAFVGYDNIDNKWKENLELKDVILELAEDLCYGCQMSEYGSYQYEKWIRKYVEAHRCFEERKL